VVIAKSNISIVEISPVAAETRFSAMVRSLGGNLQNGVRRG
jgi:hypothetical protein